MISWQLKTFEALSPIELYSILKLRGEVFVLEQSCPYVDADGKDLHSYHLLGFVGNDLAAYSRLVLPLVSYEEVSIGRVVTSTKYRNKKYGKLLMQKSIEEVQRIFGQVPIRIGAQTYLKKFYENFGFVDMNEPYVEDGIDHLIMLRP